MSIFYPDHSFRRVWEITPQWLAAQGISVLLLDVDNTLTTHNSPEVPEQVRPWLASMEAAGIRLLIFSNNSATRVKPFAEGLGLEYIAGAAKPLGRHVRRALTRLGVPAAKAAVVGDQIFTDILCGKCAGLRSVLVEPMEAEPMLFFRVKRRLERLVLKRYFK